MKTVKVVDSTFSHANAIGYGNEREGEYPRYFHWDTDPGDAEVKVFTDIRLDEAINDPTPRKIALLLEPPAVNAGIYEWVTEHADMFYAVLTHQKSLVEQGKPFLFYPFGGSWIGEWGIFPKTRMFSILISGKRLTSGHQLRFQAAKLPDVDSYGNGVGRYVQRKVQALRSYRFAIIIENQKVDWWFTEKLIDAFSQGTVPIYRGCPEIGKFFDRGGIIRWDTIEELEAIVKGLKPSDYDMRMLSIYENLKRARQYQCPEDWIVETYGDLLW